MISKKIFPQTFCSSIPPLFVPFNSAAKLGWLPVPNRLRPHSTELCNNWACKSSQWVRSSRFSICSLSTSSSNWIILKREFVKKRVLNGKGIEFLILLWNNNLYTVYTSIQGSTSIRLNFYISYTSIKGLTYMLCTPLYICLISI